MKETIKIFIVIILVVAGSIFYGHLLHLDYADAAAISKADATQKEINTLHQFIKLRRSNMPNTYARIIAESVVEQSEALGVPVELIVGIIETESIWDAMAVSSVGARGLMQIYQGETVTIEQDKAHDIAYNLNTGIEILKGKAEITEGDMVKALQNYSGNRSGYAEDVMKGMGRYLLFKWRV